VPIDRTQINEVIDRQIEAIELSRGTDVVIADIVFVLAVTVGDKSEVRARSSASPYAAIGMLRTAEQGLLHVGLASAESDSSGEPQTG
jgi:hypothetical protein